MTSKDRIKAAPDYPTVAESGVPGFEAGTWFGMFALADFTKRLESEYAKWGKVIKQAGITIKSK